MSTSIRDQRVCAILAKLFAVIAMLVLNVRPAQATLWWDRNSTTAGAGATPTGTWSAAATSWTGTSGGTVATVVWTANENARFSAGTDAINGFTVTVSGTIAVNQIGLEEAGDPTFTGGILNFTHVAAATSILTGVNGVTTDAIINSQISGTGGFKVARNTGLGNIITLGSTANNFTGGFQVNGDNTVRLGASEVIPNGNTVTLANATGAGVLDVNGFTETVTALISSGTSGSVLLGGGTLVLNAPTGQSWGGVISEAGNVTKNGSGTQTFTNSNTYTGLTTITAGVLEMGAANIFANTSTMTVNGATAILDMNANQNDTMGTVTVDGGGSINGTGTSTLTTGGNFEMKNGTVNVILAGASRPLNKTTPGTVTLNAANTYTGLTTVSAGSLTYGVSNAISSGAVTINGATAILNLGASHNDTVGIVTVDGGGSITGTGTSTLTSTGSFAMKSGSASAKLAGANIDLNKTTAASFTLTGDNTFSGDTTITAGSLLAAAVSGQSLGGTTAVFIQPTATLQLSADDEINNSASMSLDGGTLNTGGFDEGAVSTPGIGILSMTASSIIDLDGGSSLLAFANSSSATWVGTLSVYNWSGIVGAGGGTDQLYFDASTSGLTPAQLNQITFYSDAGITPLGLFNEILSSGEVIPSTPEPASLALVAAVGVMMLRRRRSI